jgi:hypothetical protein
MDYCSLFENLERRKGSATRAPSCVVRAAYALRVFSREKIAWLVTYDKRCVRVHIEITVSFLLH